MLGRFISGWGVGGLSAAVPVYQAESVPKQVRGACTATYQLAITLGSEFDVHSNRGKRSDDTETSEGPRSPTGLLFLNRYEGTRQLGLLANRHRPRSRLLPHPRCRNLLRARIPTMVDRAGPP